MEDLLHQVYLIASVLAGGLAAWYTYRQTQKKSDREGWQSLYHEMKTRADKAEKKNHDLILANERLKIENNELKSQLKS